MTQTTLELWHFVESFLRKIGVASLRDLASPTLRVVRGYLMLGADHKAAGPTHVLELKQA